MNPQHPMSNHRSFLLALCSAVLLLCLPDRAQTNAEAAAGVSGATTAGPSYPLTEQSSPSNFPVRPGTFLDDRGGGAFRYATDPFFGTGLNSVAGFGNNCHFTYNANPTATDAQFCNSDSTVISGIGNDAGGGVTRVGGDFRLVTMISNGITAEDDMLINCWHDGDCHAHRDVFQTGAPNSDLSGEGHGDFQPHFDQMTAIYVSNVAGVTDSTHIKLNFPGTGGAYGQPYGGGWLVKQANIDSGKIIADTAPSGGIPNRRFTTSTAHPVATAWGTLITPLHPTDDFVKGTPTVVTITKLGGTFPASGNVCLSGDHTYETTYSGATGASTVTATLLSRYEEPAGSLIVVGSCMKMFSVPDRQSSSINSQITSEISPDIIGAPDANTYFYTLTGVATRDQNALNGNYNWSTDLTLPQIAGSMVTRNANNNVLFPDESANNGSGYRFMGARTITVSGCADSSFNFGPSRVTIASSGNPFALSFVQPGAMRGASTTTGCSITMSALNGFTLHKAAKVISISDPAVPKNTLPLDGYMLLGTNTAGFTVGDAVEQPGANSIRIDNITEVIGQTPTLGGQPSHLIDWVLHGNAGTTGAQISGGFNPISISNQNPYAIYSGGGGLYTVPNLASVLGPWHTYWSFGNAPANGGQYVLMGCPPEGCNTPVPYDLFNLAGKVNGRLSFTPSSGLLSWDRTFFARTMTGTSGSFNSIQATQKLANGAGMQVATATGCTAKAGTLLSTCNVTVALPVAEPDTAYDVTGCTLKGAAAIMGNVSSLTTTDFVVAEYAATLSGATAGTISCLVTHN
ncbi:MAG: hypothetical protein JWQ49_4551 [Edaphobacter sp.]|nr:hypothetical protein [Edaphobacter sp.]